MSRLAIVRQKYTASGGAERFVSRAIQALQQQDEVDVTLITRRWESIDGLQVVRADPFYLGNVWRDWGFACAARRQWQQQRIDLVQSHERIAGCHIYRAGDGVHAHWLALRRRTLSLPGRLGLWLNPYHHYVCRAERRMFLDPALRLVICNSQMVKREIQALFDLPDQRFAVIYNGVDTDAFHPSLERHRAALRAEWQIPETAPLLLYVGSGFARKGVELALRAIAAHEQVFLLVVGKDKHANRYQQLAEQLGVAARVRFVGAQNDVKPFYGMADAFILPTLYDPFPNVCIEALACGLPVLTSSTCGGAELLRNGENGWVGDALISTDWPRLVADWLQARPRWLELRQAARATAEPYTLSRMAGQLLSCYRDLLGKPVESR